MAAKTNLSRSEITEILERYNFGKLIEFQPITSGTVQTNYLLVTTENKLVLRFYENRSIHSALFEADLIKYLRDRDYPCPTLYSDKYGQSIGTYGNKPYAVFEFIEGKHVEIPNENKIRQLLRRVAELHNITKYYRSPFEKYRLNYNIETCRELAEEVSKGIKTFNSQEKFKWYKDQLSELILPSDLPKGVCHCDFHFTNVLYEDDEFITLLDFDDANYTFLTYDLVCLLQPFKATFDWDTWVNFDLYEDVFDFSNAKKIVSEYIKYRPISDLEKRHLFDVYKLSILIDCIWYFERGDVKDFYEKRKIHYLDDLGRVNFYQQLFEE